MQALARGENDPTKIPMERGCRIVNMILNCEKPIQHAEADRCPKLTHS